MLQLWQDFFNSNLKIIANEFNGLYTSDEWH